MEDPLVGTVCFVAFVSDVTGEVGPGNSVGCADPVGMCDGTEGFTDVGGIGYVALGREKGGADAGCVGSVADVRVCGFWRTKGMLE